VASVDAVGIDNTRGAVGIRFTTNGDAFKRPFGFGTTGNSVYLTAGTARYEDGTNNVATAGGFWTTGVETTLVLWWSSSTACMAHVDGTAQVCGAYDGSWGTWTTLAVGRLGSGAGSAFVDGTIKKLCQGKDFKRVARCLQ
jgi:hypothetical protein